MRGRCVVWGGIRDSPFFWQFVNDAHGADDYLKRVVLLGRQQLRLIRPLYWRHFLPPCLLLEGARNLGVPTLFQVACVDTGTIRWVNADLVSRIVSRVWSLGIFSTIYL